MIATITHICELAECDDVALVGGKGANLGQLTRAGFPVPPGFVITTAAFDEARHHAAGTIPREIPDEMAEEICAAYRRLGGGAVAVRSSATAEDMAAASMAGQYETFLDVQGDAELLARVRQCWASLDAPRIRAYLAEHGFEPARVAMAVVVQTLVPADVAGVLFTANPLQRPKTHAPAEGGRLNGKPRAEMLIEASWGLGESVVSGRVQPDIYRIASHSGELLESVIAEKRVMLDAGTHQERAVKDTARHQATLDDASRRQLWELGRRAEAHFGAPQDIEWALHAGRLCILQSRPITTHGQADAREEALAAAQARLTAELAQGRGPWVVHNLAETLPRPTPLTWSILQRFMSGRGGFGEMYRQAGFEPAPAVCREGFLELICGRIYMDAARAPEMFFEHFPFAYDLEELKRNPDAAQSPPTLPRGTLQARMAAGRRLARVTRTLRTLAADFDRQFRQRHAPELVGYVQRHHAMDLRALPTGELAALWRQHEKRVLDEFGPLSLLPSMICGMALGELRAFLAEHLWEEDPDALAPLLSAGGVANRTVMADAELHAVGRTLEAGRNHEDTREADKRVEERLHAWISEHGHRGFGEFDLASPRWRELPDKVCAMARNLAAGTNPLQRHQHTSTQVNQRLAALKGRLDARRAAELDQRLEWVRRYVPFREDGKDYFMMGYELLRHVALEAGRRLGVGEGVFYLTDAEMLAALEISEQDSKKQHNARADSPAVKQPALAPLIEQRKRLHKVQGRIALPRVIDAAAVQTLGAMDATPAREAGSDAPPGQKAFALSAGVARGRALVLHAPTDLPAEGVESGYILICRSTDPSWTPLFVNAAGLILECGGTLSHGAVVARELGLPAVVVADATRRFKNGDRVEVDGTRGGVRQLEYEENSKVSPRQSETPIADPQDTRVPYTLVPPPPGPRDRAAGNVRNVMAGAWTFFILSFFLLRPAWVSQPTLAFLDSFLWPLVRCCGRPGTVVLIAAAVAIITLLLQRFLTDNARLREAKRRAALLTREAHRLPPDSARRQALRALAAPVPLRALLAALVPVGILLGPMVLPFAWFTSRVDPATWNAAPGTPVQIIAYLDTEHAASAQVAAPPGLTLDSATPAQAALPALRPVLEKLLTQYRAASAGTVTAGTWETDVDRHMPLDHAAADLQAYLAREIPPQPVRWRLTPATASTGRMTLHVRAGTEPPVPVTLVWGDATPPAAKTIIPAQGSVRQVQVLYDRPRETLVFFRPLAWLGTSAGTLATWDIGWIWLYVVAYLPVLLVMRAVLRVA